MLAALFADENGEIFDAPDFRAMGRIGRDDMVLNLDDMIPLPEGATLVYLPGRTAVGGRGQREAVIRCNALAVAALLPAGYTRTHLPAFKKKADAPVLPLYGYTAAALYRDTIYVAAVKSDDNDKWCPSRYNTSDFKKRVSKVKKQLRGNRIVEQLAHCSLKWHCCTAQNLFYHRWEAGIPVSPACNANCIGCISLQSSECCPSPQSRISFSPTPEEIAAVGTYHLSSAPEAIVSFGQGCEGEPSLAFNNIAGGIQLIRRQTNKGLININTNAGFTGGIRAIVDAGLDSMRVSMISAIPKTYQAYYRSDYDLEDVKQSIFYAREKGVRVSLNMLFFPGLNDREEELKAWIAFLDETRVAMVQLRNLNFDPDLFLDFVPLQPGKSLGVKVFLTHLQNRYPNLLLGSFSHFFEK
ncbi:radical SAM protein [Propionispora sp. 2/2-37]|uniref:radical SAM protein n=1 Tax=Propionispora sp. 2/2-37 TaxID=1677858 RepID=UPI0006BB55C5|nr:radical SAM protein [Propionispora sp. 2/2-37]